MPAPSGRHGSRPGCSAAAQRGSGAAASSRVMRRTSPAQTRACDRLPLGESGRPPGTQEQQGTPEQPGRWARAAAVHRRGAAGVRLAACSASSAQQSGGPERRCSVAPWPRRTGKRTRRSRIPALSRRCQREGPGRRELRPSSRFALAPCATSAARSKVNAAGGLFPPPGSGSPPVSRVTRAPAAPAPRLSLAAPLRGGSSAAVSANGAGEGRKRKSFFRPCGGVAAVAMPGAAERGSELSEQIEAFVSRLRGGGQRPRSEDTARQTLSLLRKIIAHGRWGWAGEGRAAAWREEGGSGEPRELWGRGSL